MPYAWLLANCPDAVDEYDVYEAVAKQPAANGRLTVADCYVAGLDPNDPAAEFKAVIEMVDGVPVVTPSPDLKDERVYKVLGKTSLEDAGEWQYPTNALHHFFKISVEMPSGKFRFQSNHGTSGARRLGYGRGCTREGLTRRAVASPMWTT